MTEPNTKRKLISKRLVDISSLVAVLRSKNPYANNDIIQSLERFQGYDFCCDMLEKLLKEERK